ncbi:MAG: transglutaminase domain-containing protein [Lachnospiraceae bacterium]|nr:transglutaminase domain-containing protein [Lachnospiraceae bacterium]
MAKKTAKKELNNSIELCQGIVLSDEFIEKKENRVYTLLLKGIIVYLLSMGAIGFYMSAIDAKYNVFLCHIVIFIFALVCSFLYYRLLTENLGYLILLVLFAGLVYLFRIYINSGFYAVLNISVDRAAQYFDVDIQRLYNEQISNRYITITMISLFIGIVLDILLNVYISRRMQYATAMFIVMFFNVIPLYMLLEPDTIYALMVLTGISMAYVIKVSRHYSPQVAIKRTDNKYETRGRKQKELFYNYDIKSIGQAALLVFLYIAVVITIASTVRPKDSFNVGYRQNKYKELTMAAMSTLLLEGWEGFYNYSNDTGGMNSGILGNVGSVHLDYQTDLMVRVAPYSYGTIYLKHFEGESYNPYQNYWTSLKYFYSDEEGAFTTPEADALERAFEEGGKNSSKGIISIRNIDADRNGLFEPYYFKNVEDTGNYGYMDMVFYPRLIGNDVSVMEEDYFEEPYTDMDLYVPEENIEAIEEFIQNIDTSGTDEDKINSVINYFQEEIPYMIKPGKTPRKKDFVNYFLQENKKGYCAHYASSATLIFRYLGIPARYIEGYAISYNQFVDAELVENVDYSDYYEGFSVLGETAVLEVSVTDADAHAWVEVYDENMGWYVVDVTPYGEIEETEDFWTMFDNVMGGNDDGEEDDGNQAGITISDSFVRGVVYFILGVISSIILVWLAIKGIGQIIFWVRFKNAGINDKLIIKYSLFYKKKSRRYKELKKKINYREQIEYLYDKQIEKNTDKTKGEIINNMAFFEKDKVIGILNIAGFSDKAISEEDYDYVCSVLNKIN